MPTLLDLMDSPAYGSTTTGRSRGRGIASSDDSPEPEDSSPWAQLRAIDPSLPAIHDVQRGAAEHESLQTQHANAIDMIRQHSQTQNAATRYARERLPANPTEEDRRRSEEALGQRRDWQDISQEILDRNPAMTTRHTDRLRPVYERYLVYAEQAERLRQAREQASKDAADPVIGAALGVLRRLPLSGMATHVWESGQYKEARERFQEGRPQPEDYGIIAMHDAQHEAEAAHQEGWIGYLANAAGHAGTFAAEAALGGAALRGAAAIPYAGAGLRAIGIGGEVAAAGNLGSGMAAPTLGALTRAAATPVAAFGARTALTTAAMPSMYIPGAMENADRFGGDWHNLRNLAPSFAIGTINTAILGQVAGGLPGRGVGGFLVRVGAGMGEQQIADIGISLIGEATGNQRFPHGDEGYGIGGAISREQNFLRNALSGDSPALKAAAGQAITFAVFGLMHGGEGKPEVLTRAAEYATEQQRRGISSQRIGQSMASVQDALAELMQKNPNPTRAEAREAVKSWIEEQPGVTVPESLRKFAEAMADVFPEEGLRGSKSDTWNRYHQEYLDAGLSPAQAREAADRTDAANTNKDRSGYGAADAQRTTPSEQRPPGRSELWNRLYQESINASLSHAQAVENANRGEAARTSDRSGSSNQSVQETQVSTGGAHRENAPPETAPTPPKAGPTAEQKAESFWDGGTDLFRKRMLGLDLKSDVPTGRMKWEQLSPEQKSAAMKNMGLVSETPPTPPPEAPKAPTAAEVAPNAASEAPDPNRGGLGKRLAPEDQARIFGHLETGEILPHEQAAEKAAAPAPPAPEAAPATKQSRLSELLAKSNELGIESAKDETDAEKADLLERRLDLARETRAEIDRILPPKEAAVLWERIQNGTTNEQIAKDKIILREDGKPYTGRAGIKEVEKRALKKLATEAGQDVAGSIAKRIHAAEADAGKRAQAEAGAGTTKGELNNPEGKKGKKELTLDDRIEHLNDRYEGIIEANGGVHTPEIHARYSEDAERMYRGEASRMTEEMLDAVKESMGALGANTKAVRKILPELSNAQANELIRDIQGGKDAIGIEANRRAKLGVAEVVPASRKGDRPVDPNTPKETLAQDAETPPGQPPNDSGLGTNAADSGGQAAGLGTVRPDKEGSRRFASGVESETALAKGVAAEEREAMGLPKQQEADRIANAKTNAEAGAAIAKDPSLAAKLLADLAKSSRATTALENAILLRHKNGLEAKLAKAEQAANAEKDPKTKADLYVQSDKLRTEFQDFLDVVGKQGTTAGRALQFYAQLMKQDYSLGGMLRRAEAAAKRPLEPKEREKIGDQAKEIQHATEEMQKKAEAVDKGGWDDKGAQDSYEESVLNQRRKIVEHQDDIAAFRWKAMTPGERAIDWLKKLRVAELISSPITLGKVGSSGILQTFAPAVNNMVGAGLRMLPGIRPVAAKAAIEGHGFNAANEGAAIKAAGTTGLKAGWDTIRTGRSNLDIRYGPDPTTPRVWADWIGDLHGAEKAPAVEAMFQRTRLNLMDAAKARGEKLTSGLIESINKRAYEKSKEAKFQEDGAVADQVGKFINALKKHESPLGRVVGHAVDVMLPIRKTPGNIVAAAFEHALGLPVGGTRLGIAHLKGIENLTSPQAEGIMRQLKRGTLGLPLLMLGYFASGSLGGFYTGRRTEDEVQEGEIKTPLGNLPAWVTAHHPAFMALQLGASIRRAEEDVKKNGQQGLGTGIVKGLGALMEEIPYVKEQTEVARAFEGGFNENAVGRIAASFAMPALFQWLATSTDREGGLGLPGQGTAQLRRPEGFLQQIEARTPGLRQMTPETTRAVQDLHTELSRLSVRRQEAAHRGMAFPQEHQHSILSHYSHSIAQLEHAAQGDARAGTRWFGHPAGRPSDATVAAIRRRQAELARAALEAIR
jgi:hypothetical protein